MIPAPDNVTGLLLAGGKSTRFGEDKALFLWQGKPLLAHSFAMLQAVTGAVLLSVPPNDPRDLGLSAPRVFDPVPSCGPLGGLQAGLAAAQTDWLLVLPCDMPFMTVSALESLLAARSSARKAVVAQAPAGRLHPLCACYHRSVRSTVETCLQSGRLAMHQFLAALPLGTVHPLTLSDAVLRNINQPRDLLGG